MDQNWKAKRSKGRLWATEHENNSKLVAKKIAQVHNLLPQTRQNLQFRIPGMLHTTPKDVTNGYGCIRAKAKQFRDAAISPKNPWVPKAYQFKTRTEPHALPFWGGGGGRSIRSPPCLLHLSYHAWTTVFGKRPTLVQKTRVLSDIETTPTCLDCLLGSILCTHGTKRHFMHTMAHMAHSGRESQCLSPEGSHKL